MIFTTDLAKDHLRIEHSLEDDYIEALCSAVESHFQSYTNRTLYADEASLPVDEDSALVLNDAIRQGGLVLISWLYENREGAHGDDLPLPTRLLWDPYRWITV